MSDVLKKALASAESDKSLVERRIRDLRQVDLLLSWAGSSLVVQVMREVRSQDEALSVSAEASRAVRQAVSVELTRQAVALAAVHGVTLEVSHVD